MIYPFLLGESSVLAQSIKVNFNGAHALLVILNWFSLSLRGILEELGLSCCVRWDRKVGGLERVDNVLLPLLSLR